MKLFTKLLAVSMALITVVATTLSLSACKYKDPVDLPQEDQSPYGNYDYSKRAFLSKPSTGCCIYKGDAYTLNPVMKFRRVSLMKMENDLRTSQKIAPQTFSICQDSTHEHERMGGSLECPDYVLDPFPGFLIDAYESAGDFPIIYYYRSLTAGPSSAWDESITYEIIRYDTGKAQTETLTSSPNPIIQMMTYDQSVFFVTLTAQRAYELSVVSKKGGEVTTITAGEGKLTLLGVYNERVIFRDKDGAVYQAGLDLQNCGLIFQAPEMYSMSSEFQGLFVHGQYLYYPDDYEAIPYPISDDGTQVMQLMKHTVRRISLDNPQGAGELVADNVFDHYMFGITDNVFYYSPCVAGKVNRGYYHNFTGGILKGVNVETLEPVEIQEDTGLEFISLNAFSSGDGIISVSFPMREGYNIKYTDGGYVCLYDIKTGALYPLYMTE